MQQNNEYKEEVKKYHRRNISYMLHMALFKTLPTPLMTFFLA